MRPFIKTANVWITKLKKRMTDRREGNKGPKIGTKGRI